MDDEEDWLIGLWLPGRWGAIIRGIGLIAMLIALSCVGFWQVFVIVADHWGGKPGDGRVSDGTCLASTSDPAECRLPPLEAD